MQANKKNNNGWILCPSKSFPGKLYYFNVVNGEAAWSLNDVDKKCLKQDYTIQKIADKSHSFPEPDTPPLDNFTTNICHQPAPNYLTNMEQRFGEPVYPKYFPSVAPVFWAPVQMMVPEAKKITSQVTQTFEPDSILHHSTDVPLSKRFSKPIFCNENKFQNRFVSNKFCDNSNKLTTNRVISKYESNQTETADLFKYPKIQPLLKPIPRSNSESGISTEVPFLFNNVKENSTLNLPNRVNFNQSTFTQTPSWSVHTLTQSNKAENPGNQKLTKKLDSSNIDKQKSSLKTCSEVDNSDGIEYNNLDSEDLRFLLVAKRRKSIDCGDIRGGKKPKSDSVSNITLTKKRVTFDLGSLDDSGSEDNEPKYTETIVEVKHPSIEQLRNLANPSMNRDCWYLVVDTEILLDNYEFIDQYVQSDVRCKLLIPDVVRSDIQSMSKGDCCGRHRIIVARQLFRRLSMPWEHVVLQSDMGEDNQLVTNSILNCCIEITRVKNRHVVLITNDTVLLNKAKTLSIHGYKLQDIKDGIVPKQKVSFDIRKGKKLHVNDDVKENLFLQNIATNKDPKNIFKSLFNSTTDIVDDDRLINITKPKNITRTNMESTINYESDTIDSTSEIGRNIKGINIKENKVIKKSLFDSENQFEKLNFNNATKSTKLIYIEDDIKRYYVKNKLMEDKIRLRIDEWICTFSQIMEDILTAILLQNSSHHRIPPPWYLCEAVECIKRMYNQESNIVSVINKFSLLLFNCSSDKGKLKTSINAKDFMKILGYGITLIHTLQDITPSQELKEAKNKLDAMLHTIEDPTVELDKEFITPVVSRIDATERIIPKRFNFEKNRADIVQYLKNNFPQWKSYNEEVDIHYNNNDKEHNMNYQNKVPKIVRTLGKNVGLLTIDNSKNISMITPSKPHGLVVDTNKKTEGTKVLRIVKSINDMCNTTGKGADTTKIHNNIDIAMPKLLRTIQTKEERKNGPKVIRNFGNVDRYLFEKNENQSQMLDNNKVNLRADMNIFGNDLNMPKHGNTFKVAEEKTDGPKVIRPFENVNTFSLKQSGSKFRENDNQLGVIKRDIKKEPKVVINMKVIDAFEEKIKNKAIELNMDDLDYEVEDSLSTIKVKNISPRINNCDDDQFNDEAKNNVYYPDNSPQIHNTRKKYLPSNENLINDTLVSRTTSNENNENSDTTITSVFFNIPHQNTNFAQNNDTSDDSGFENESLQAYSLAKSFLTEISSSFKMIYKFIDQSINEVRDEVLEEDKKKILHNKANRTHLHIAQVIEKLKRIIERESTEGTTLKSFLIKAGDVSGDKRMCRYRQVVKKSLEQAQLLEKAIKLMLKIIDYDFADHPSFTAENPSNNNNLKYYNIFE